MDLLTRNQDFASAFLNHPDYLSTSGVVLSTGSFAIYDQAKGIFEIQEQEDFVSRVYRFMLSCAKKSISMSAVNDVAEQIKELTIRRFPDFNTQYLALSDCLLNMVTFETTPFDIEKNAFFSLNFPSKFFAAPPLFETSRFKQFLSEVLVTDESLPDQELITLIQEMFGYCLLTSNICEASFFLVGEGSNGKSVLLYLLENMIGQRYCASLSIEAMTTSEHSTTNLVGKRLNICYEEESAFVKSDKFKALVSGEPTTVNYKYGKIYSTRLPVKYIFATNELPTFSGFNHGLLRRIKIIPFKRKFSDSEMDRSLKYKLVKDEMPTIMAWALQGAKRLVENNFQLSASTASAAAKTDFESNLSAAVSFIREEYQEDANSFMFYSDLYARFVEWCKENGKKQMSKPTFIRDITRVLALPASISWNSETRKAERGRPLRTLHSDQSTIPL